MYLFKDGKFTLIKLVLASLPTYYLSLFVIPILVAMLIEKMQRRFLWEKWKGLDSWHLVAWDEVCKPMQFGGLDIKRIRDFNRALLTKRLWRFGVEEDNLWRRVIVDKYGMVNKWETKKVNGAHGFSLWKGIDLQLEMFKKAISMDIGRGNETFWLDKCCCSGPRME